VHSHLYLIGERDQVRMRMHTVLTDGRCGATSWGPRLGVRWWRFGAELLHPGGEPPAAGFLLLQPLAWLPQRLERPVECIAQQAEEGGTTRVWLRFSPQPPGLRPMSTSSSAKPGGMIRTIPFRRCSS